MKMSKNLIKLSQNLVDLISEAIETKNLEISSTGEERKQLSDKFNSILLNARKIVSDYSESLKEVSNREIVELEKLSVRRKEIKKFAKKQKQKIKVSKKFRTYKTNYYSKISNFFMENLSFLLSKRYPDQFRRLSDELSLADIKILSRTYLSIILFTTFIAFPIATVVSFIFTLKIWVSLLIGLIASVTIFAILYKYPSIQKKNRAKHMDQELVFAYFHMSAVASSGAPPINVFKLLLESREYKFLQSDFERILNYINVFGYNLTTALKAVAGTTPSNRFKDFLYGMSTNIETGGSIKEFLKGKADDELVKSRLDQQKYLETVSTFSEIYIGVLIAAPLLFVITLAILEKISPFILGIPINIIAIIGVIGLLPVLNLLFLLLFEASKVEK